MTQWELKVIHHEFIGLYIYYTEVCFDPFFMKCSGVQPYMSVLTLSWLFWSWFMGGKYVILLADTFLHMWKVQWFTIRIKNKEVFRFCVFQNRDLVPGLCQVDTYRNPPNHGSDLPYWSHRPDQTWTVTNLSETRRHPFEVFPGWQSTATTRSHIICHLQLSSFSSSHWENITFLSWGINRCDTIFGEKVTSTTDNQTWLMKRGVYFLSLRV